MRDRRQALGARRESERLEDGLEHPFAVRDRHTRCARPDWLMRRACSRPVGHARSLDVCLDSRGPFIDALNPRRARRAASEDDA